MSNQTEEKKESDIGVVPLQTLFDKLKDGTWKYYIDHEDGREMKGSIQLKARIIDVATNKSITDGNAVIKASGIIIKNGPFTEKGQQIPQDVLRAASKSEKSFKTNVEFGVKSSGALGVFTEWFSENIWPEAVQDVAKRYGLSDPNAFIIPFAICKKTYGSKKNPGDAKKKEAYIAAADWKYNVKIRGNTKTGACFGFTLYGYEATSTGPKKVEIAVTAKNMSTWFRNGNRGIMIYEISDVTLNSNNTVHTFYHGRQPVEFHLKRESRKKTYTDAVSTDEMDDLCGDLGPDAGRDDASSGCEDNDYKTNENASTGPATSEDVEAQLAKLGV